MLKGFRPLHLWRLSREMVLPLAIASVQTGHIHPASCRKPPFRHARLPDVCGVVLIALLPESTSALFFEELAFARLCLDVINLSHLSLNRAIL